MLDISLGAEWERTATAFKDASMIKNAQVKMLEMATLMAWGKAKELAPTAKDTLRRSINREVDKNEGVGRIKTNVAYAKFQEFGTGIYAGRGMIRPVRAKVLSWIGSGGQRVFAGAVKGTPARHFMKGGLEEVKDRLTLILEVGKKALFGQV